MKKRTQDRRSREGDRRTWGRSDTAPMLSALAGSETLMFKGSTVAHEPMKR